MSYAQRIDRELERRDSDLWDAHEAGEHDDPVPDCARCGKALREAPDPSWEEDEDGYLRAPLSYLNPEGDPNLNGAFDKW